MRIKPNFEFLSGLFGAGGEKPHIATFDCLKVSKFRRFSDYQDPIKV